MDYSKDFIYKSVISLLKDKDILTMSELETKYKSFKTDFPKWYETCLSDERPDGLIDGLKKYLNIRDDIIENKVTDFQASLVVAEEKSEEYLYPKIGAPTEEQRKAAMKKIEKKMGGN